MKYIIAIYLRLSKEDENLVDESNSITNQRHITYNQANKLAQQEDIDNYEVREYIDDGYSGKNFNRPSVKRLLDDIRRGIIHVVIVKDFSRFARNHIEIGEYIERIFPLIGIRFIAINNSYDSDNFKWTTPGMDVTFENLVYDYYSEETSIKIKESLKNRRAKGKYMAVFAPYGYIKSNKNNNQLVVDDVPAMIVKFIFEKYAELCVKEEVARILNKNEIMTPQEYHISRGLTYHWKYQKGKKKWNGSIVARILRNQVYLGHTVYNQKRVIEVGSKITQSIPKEEWLIYRNSHEALVSEKLFEFVNSDQCKVVGSSKEEEISEKEILDPTIYCEGERRRRGDKYSPIKGLVTCGGCKHVMTRRNRLNATYYCRYYYQNKDEECCSVNIKEKDLMDIVLTAIKNQSILIGNLLELESINKDTLAKKKRHKQKLIDELNSNVNKYETENFQLYERYKNEEVSMEIFLARKEKNNKLIESNKQKIIESQFEIEESSSDYHVLSIFDGKDNLTELTTEVVQQLVSSIYVYDDKRVMINFKFKDEMQNLIHSTGIEQFQKIF